MINYSQYHEDSITRSMDCQQSTPVNQMIGIPKRLQPALPGLSLDMDDQLKGLTEKVVCILVNLVIGI